MKKIIFASACFVISIMISLSTFNLTRDQQGSITLSSLSEANAQSEGVEIICNREPGQCWAYGYGWCTAAQQYSSYCFFSGSMMDHCDGVPC